VCLREIKKRWGHDAVLVVKIDRARKKSQSERRKSQSEEDIRDDHDGLAIST
jgi:hypothetical protein